jgi:hypothetical protein
VISFEGPKVASILRLAAPLLAAFAVFFGACTMTETEEWTVSGAGIGAAIWRLATRGRRMNRHFRVCARRGAGAQSVPL